jgi:hypothetical protein
VYGAVLHVGSGQASQTQKEKMDGEEYTMNGIAAAGKGRYPKG